MNESDSNSEDWGYSNLDKSEWKSEELRTERVTDQEIYPMEIKWNWKKENKLRGEHKKGSQAILQNVALPRR